MPTPTDLSSTPNQYVIHKGFAGLGNRIAALVTAILYAKITQRTLVIDWRDKFYSSDSSNAFESLFHTQHVDVSTSCKVIETITEPVAPHIWTGHLHQQLPHLLSQETKELRSIGQRMFMKYSINVAKLAYHQDYLVYCSYIEEISKLKRHFKNELLPLKRSSNEEIFKFVFNTYLKLESSLNQRIDNFIATHFTQNYVIGFHVRHTDKSISLKRYERAFEEHLARYPDAIFFLATDNRVVEQDFLKKYPDKVFVLDKWLPDDGLKAHGNSACPDLTQHARESLMDIVLLSRCDRLIYSRTTTFAQVARIISKTLSPERCFDIQIYEEQHQKSWQERISSINRSFQGRVKKISLLTQLLRS